MNRTEDAIAEQVICPLDSCKQPVGSPCLTADNRLAKQAHNVRLHRAEQRRGERPWNRVTCDSACDSMSHSHTCEGRWSRRQVLLAAQPEPKEQAVDEALARLREKAMAAMEEFVMKPDDAIAVTLELVLRGDGTWEIT